MTSWLCTPNHVGSWSVSSTCCWMASWSWHMHRKADVPELTVKSGGLRFLRLLSNVSSQLMKVFSAWLMPMRLQALVLFRMLEITMMEWLPVQICWGIFFISRIFVCQLHIRCIVDPEPHGFLQMGSTSAVLIMWSYHAICFLTAPFRACCRILIWAQFILTIWCQHCSFPGRHGNKFQTLEAHRPNLATIVNLCSVAVWNQCSVSKLSMSGRMTLKHMWLPTPRISCQPLFLCTHPRRLAVKSHTLIPRSGPCGRTSWIWASLFVDYIEDSSWRHSFAAGDCGAARCLNRNMHWLTTMRPPFDASKSNWLPITSWWRENPPQAQQACPPCREIEATATYYSGFYGFEGGAWYCGANKSEEDQASILAACEKGGWTHLCWSTRDGWSLGGVFRCHGRRNQDVSGWSSASMETEPSAVSPRRLSSMSSRLTDIMWSWTCFCSSSYGQSNWTWSSSSRSLCLQCCWACSALVLATAQVGPPWARGGHA